MGTVWAVARDGGGITTAPDGGLVSTVTVVATPYVKLGF
jgi:hypothetical protein